ncbi:hypothetical protein PGT21_016116 [Puccinia graminis f. sp. tritici]|uniref:Uncharacterized protein n=1 Tax=Puccinia graminis f. sp. tritici TaxID=56615 RepID=A0A5B0PR53_PUCGR|nr:hypothetical protein PGT21_016116 [Puccinia graminis f. sp. tritici]
MDCHSGGQPPSLLIPNPVLVNLALKLLGADGVSDDFAWSSQHDSLYPKVQLALQQVTAPKGSLIVIANEGDTGLSLDRRRLHSDLEGPSNGRLLARSLDYHSYAVA